MRTALKLCLCFWGATAAFGQTTLSPEDARLAAARLLSAGQHTGAAEITEVLVQRDPGDTTSLILHAHAARNLGRLPAAQKSARQAWKSADRDIEKYGAALAMAQALSSDGHKTRAQFWLRRAAHVAPSEQMRRRAVRDYSFVRQTNPWSVNLSFGINPSNNVNNAPRDNTIILGGLVFTNPTAVPISGFEIQNNVTLRYNFNEEQKSRNFVALNWSENHVVFTDDNAPAGVEEADFAFRRIEAQVGRDFITGPGKPRQTISVSYGRLWSGGDVLADELRLSWKQVYKRPSNRGFAWTADLGYSDRKDNDIRSGVTGSLRGQWSRPLANGDRISWDAAVGRSDTDSAAITHSNLSLGAQYIFGEPILGARAQVAISNQYRKYDDPLYGPDPRSDAKLSISGSLLFVDFDTYGFAPKLTLEASQTNSNVTRFETRNFGLNIGFQSLF